jgi:hypothetical protein
MVSSYGNIIIYKIYLSYAAYLLVMTSDNESQDSKNRGEVYQQERQRVAEQSKRIGSGERRDPKNRGEVYQQEQQRVAEQSKRIGSGERRDPKNRGEVYQQEQQRVAEQSNK